MKIALVHDFLLEFGGAERVLLALKQIYPEADVYTAYYDPNVLGEFSETIKTWKVKTSWANKVPMMRRLHSPLRFLYPLIWKSFDFSGYDLVITSCNHFSKGITTKKPTLHICYLHHPPRYLYGYKTALEWQKYLPVKVYAMLINHFLRLYDFETAQNPDFYIANSKETQSRIKKFYRRDSAVIYPPVALPEKLHVTRYALHEKPYYITVSRLARAKNVDILVKAANQGKFNLKIIGTGRDENYLRTIAGPKVEFLGKVSDEELSRLYAGAEAFLFASQDEEFGIAPIEAMGYGVPVIAYKSGGLIETIKDGVNGFLFDDLTSDSLIKTVNRLTSQSEAKYLQMCQTARTEAEKYSEAVFKEKILKFVGSHVSSRTCRL